MTDQPQDQEDRRFSSFNLTPNSSAIKAIREKAKLSQTEFGKRIRVSRVTVSNYERGIGGIGEDTVNRIAEEFDVPFVVWPNNGRAFGCDNPPKIVN